ncbi:MAG: hypothetical protein IT327_03310 [Anaerolineae bacterium]|nr:hypothetical protein [Anaerolineae bacterium]
MTSFAFNDLVHALQKPAIPSASEPYWLYPLPEAEMILRYGLRPLTPAEQAIFPGLPLTLSIDKVRLMKPLASVPKARVGWIVWLAETYPAAYLLRLPGGATLPVPYNQMIWERVPSETAVTTLEDFRAQEQRQLAEAQKWRPDQTITTRGTRLSFSSLTEWIGGWQQLQGRAHSNDRYQKEGWHLQALPPEMIMAETDEMVLYQFLSLLKEDDALPPKGSRTNHATTPLVVAAHNRLTQLGAVPYRQHLQRKRLHQVLAAQLDNRIGKRPHIQGVDHLTLF